MRRWMIALSGFAFAGCLICQKAEASPLGQPISSSESLRNEKALLKYVWPLLKADEKSGRIYYEAACRPDDNGSIRFPQFEGQPPSTGKTGLAAIRDVFRNDKRVVASEDEPGIIRIRIGSISDDILRTKISILTLGPLAQYNDALAIDAIENTKEVLAAARRLKVRVPQKVWDYILVQPGEGRPHLSASMTNVTMDQALDAVAVTFKGVVLFGVCVPQGLYDINVAGGVYFDDRWLVTGSDPQ